MVRFALRCSPSRVADSADSRCSISQSIAASCLPLSARKCCQIVTSPRTAALRSSRFQPACKASGYGKRAHVRCLGKVRAAEPSEDTAESQPASRTTLSLERREDGACPDTQACTGHNLADDQILPSPTNGLLNAATCSRVHTKSTAKLIGSCSLTFGGHPVEMSASDSRRRGGPSKSRRTRASSAMTYRSAEGQCGTSYFGRRSMPAPGASGDCRTHNRPDPQNTLDPCAARAGGPRTGD